MQHSKRVIAFILLCAVLISSVSCGETENPSGTGTVTSVQETEVNTNETTTEAEIQPNLPALDVGGESTRFLTNMEANGAGQWTAADIFVEGQNGEVINDAVYERNIIIEEKYNTKIEQEFMDIGGQYSYSMYKAISKLNYAGDNTYDVIMPTIQDTALLARDGMLYDLNEIGNIDLTKPWWNARFVSDTAIGDKNYFANGDICMAFMRAVYCVLFNKKSIEDYSLENPYDLVNDGKWTIDKVLEMGEVSVSDLNGDGTMDETDGNGLLVLDNQVEALYTASGNKFVTVDENGQFIFNGDSESSINVLNQIYKLYESTSVFCPSDQKRISADAKGKNHVNVAADAFSANKAMFLLGTMNNVPRMRDMAADFGVLPLPKATDTQEDYYSYVQTWASGCAAIPITVSDINKSSIILEDMAYYARKLMTPAYYEVALKTKYARDEQSKSMLDIIYDSRTCDLGNLFNIGKLVSGLTKLIYADHKDTFASFIETKRESINTTLAELTELYSK